MSCITGHHAPRTHRRYHDLISDAAKRETSRYLNGSQTGTVVSSALGSMKLFGSIHAAARSRIADRTSDCRAADHGCCDACATDSNADTSSSVRKLPIRVDAAERVVSAIHVDIP